MSYLLVFLLAITSITSGIAYFEYKQTLNLHDKINTLEIKTKVQDETIKGYANQLQQTIERVEFVQHQNALIESNAQVKIDVLTSHNLDYLAQKKAGLIETRVNRGTQKALDALESLTDPQWHP